jgi:hypothetical protein
MVASTRAHNQVEDLVMQPKEGKRIRCIAGENACPPEDVGGASAYFDFVAAIRDPIHAEHNSNLQWVGGFFDPSAFDLADVNDRLATIK